MGHRWVGKGVKEEKLYDDELMRLSQLALNKSSDMFMWGDQTGHILYVNEAACRTLGYTRDELLSMKVMDIDSCYDEKRYSRFWDVVKRLGSVKLESVFVRKDGSRFPVQMTIGFVKVGEKEYGFNFVRDVAEQKQFEEALKESKTFLNKVFASIQDGVSVLDTGLNIVSVNPVMEKWYGTGIAGKKCFEAYHGRSSPCVKCPSTRAIQEKLMQSDVVPFHDEDGGQRGWLEVYAFPLEDDDGNVIGVIEHVRDITRRTRAEHALQESEEHLRVLAETTKAGISLYRGDKSIYANPALEKMSGYTNAELLSAVAWDIVHPDYRELVKSRAMDRERGLSVPDSYEFPILTKGGETRWVEVFAGLIMYKGEPTRMATYFDITERKRAEKALVREKHILTKSQEIAHLGSWALDVEAGRFTGSDENDRIHGYEPGDTRPTREWVLSRVHSEDRAMVAGFMEVSVRDGKRGSIDYRVIRPDGSFRYVHAIVDKTILDKAGKVTRLYGITQDITEWKRAEEELAEAKARAELYVDLMGHDINNMNQSAQGFLELALQTLEMDGKIGRDGKMLIEKPLQAIEGSSRLISNVRKLQLLADEGVKMRPVDLCDLFAELKSLDFHVGDRDATISIHDAPHCLVEGSDLLRDVFFNLISNAVKHSKPDRPVTVDVRVEYIDLDGRAYYRCTVEDDGPGIPDDLKPKLFHRFQRGKTQAYGKGLGLYLVRTIVEGYHGKVRVEDRVKGDHAQGSRFVVMLPAVDK